MLRKHQQIRAQFHQVLDGAIYSLSLWGAHYLRFRLPLQLAGSGPGSAPFEDYLSLWLLILPLAPLVLSSQGYYDRTLNRGRRETLWVLVRACSLMTLALILVVWSFRIGDVISRATILLSAPIALVFLFAKGEAVKRSYRSGSGGALSGMRLILAGAESDLSVLRARLQEEISEHVTIAKEVDLNKVKLEALVEYLHDHSVSGVVLSPRHLYFGLVEKVIQACELEGVEVWLLADFFKTQISRTGIDELAGKPVLVFRSTPETSWQSLFKIAFDYVAAFLLLLCTSWIFVIVAAVIKIASPGPVFFKQLRSGLNGQPFMMYKFRSMATNAEQRKHELESMNEMTGPVFKITRDPRVTPIGKFLRKWSIDELPQLFNVLKGEMSIVGPRPLPVDEVRRFNDLAHRRRLSVKPGLTCLWQINGRNKVSDFKDWVRMDLEYIDNWSIWLDLKIVCQTVPAVFMARGAR